MAGTQPGAQARPAGQPIGRRRRTRLCKVLRKMAYPDSSQDVPPRANVARESDAPGAIEAATSRLLAALDALEAAVERRREHDRGEDRLAAQVQALGTDRSKLAADLDSQAAHTRRLEATNREIARRLDIAMETIRSVLDAHEA
jgi:uncharacterized membrane protein YccC